MESNDIFSIIVAFVLGALSIWALHLIKEKPFAKKYVNQFVVDVVTAGIILYVVCIWFVGSLTVLVHSNAILPF